MKFRIIRDYHMYQPQVWKKDPWGYGCYYNIGVSYCYTIEEARKVCEDYKVMKENPVVEEFEL